MMGKNKRANPDFATVYAHSGLFIECVRQDIMVPRDHVHTDRGILLPPAFKLKPFIIELAVKEIAGDDYPFDRKLVHDLVETAVVVSCSIRGDGDPGLTEMHKLSEM